MDDTCNITGKEYDGRETKEHDARYQRAVRRLVENFAAVPERWARAVAKESGDEFFGVMWGTMFLVNNHVDQERILALLRDIDDEDLGTVREIADTGVYAWEIDGELVLGINGAGYDFYSEHWNKLYDALGYRWHETN